MPKPFILLLTTLAAATNTFQRGIGHGLRWLVLIMTVTVVIIVLSRIFNVDSTALQESITYMHACSFMLCLAYTAHHDGHVRVDILYRHLGEEGKAWVNLLGSILFMLPFAVFMSLISWKAAEQSWSIHEGSINPGGLPFVYLLKSLMPLAGILLALHAISDICHQLLQLSLRRT